MVGFQVSPEGHGLPHELFSSGRHFAPGMAREGVPHFGAMRQIDATGIFPQPIPKIGCNSHQINRILLKSIPSFNTWGFRNRQAAARLSASIGDARHHPARPDQ